MGCVSSKLIVQEIEKEKLRVNGGYIHHVVSLTSSTYGVLSLDKESKAKQSIKECVSEAKKSSPPHRDEPPEIINACELMEGLDEEIAIVIQSKRSPLFLHGFPDKNQMTSPRKTKKFVGKENIPQKPSSSIKGSPKSSSLRERRSLGPLFTTEEEIKKMVSSSSSTRTFLESYKKLCPPGGENAVIIYTTTLRGIRKTFEDCNVARSIIESRNVEMYERDISMHSEFKEELRVVMGSREVRVPLVFVKGRLIGGADEMVKLDEEGKLGALFDGIPAAAEGGCRWCDGVRFVMCVECSGSCRVFGEDGRKSVKCGECNENGLMQCPRCCLSL